MNNFWKYPEKKEFPKDYIGYGQVPVIIKCAIGGYRLTTYLTEYDNLKGGKGTFVDGILIERWAYIPSENAKIDE